MGHDAVPMAIIGSGNIGTDLLYKALRNRHLEVVGVIGIDAESPGLRLASDRGCFVTSKGLEDYLERGPDAQIFFDATSARAHLDHAPILRAAQKHVIDLTPAAVGPFVVPSVNLAEHLDKDNVNMLSCGGQATIPIIYAVSRVAQVTYAEIVSTVSSRSAGPGTRQNLDEFVDTTSKGIKVVGRAPQGKAMAIINPAEPPILMTNTIYVEYDQGQRKEIEESIQDMVSAIRHYVPGYQLRTPPLIEATRVTMIVQVEGAGDYLPKFAGNLDIMTAAAIRVGEALADVV